METIRNKEKPAKPTQIKMPGVVIVMFNHDDKERITPINLVKRAAS